jgi:hypothetical protein
MKKILFASSIITLLNFGIYAQTNVSTYLYDVNTNLESRSISFENPTGEPGSGGQAVNSQLGPGRKGFPCKTIQPGETIVLCDIKNNGTIRHIWMTGDFMNHSWMKDKLPERSRMLRSTVIRAYWDGQEYPSIECPVGDFMGLAHSKVTSYQSAVHSIGEQAALNIWLPMPFTKNARITITNESDIGFTLFYQIDYTINDQHNDDVGRLHVCFRRENPTTKKVDFELLPKRTGKGRFIGSVIGIRTLGPGWWGEGEVKFYMDGDSAYPTICGTGSEDFVGLSYGVQKTTFLYHGCNLDFISGKLDRVMDDNTGDSTEMHREYVSMYRWFIKDPVYWKKECRVTMQQIGCCFFERKDDWSAATFWYESIPSAPLPKMPGVNERTNDLDELLSGEN